MATVQGLLPWAREGRASRVALYGDVGAGLAIAKTTFRAMTTDDSTSRDWYAGPAFALGAGLKFETSLADLGFTIGYQFQFLHAIDNLDGDTHASGGHRVVMGLFYAF